MEFKQGHALVIGVGTHQYEPENDVPITVSDAQAVAAILANAAKCGYPKSQVTFLHDDTATSGRILGALDKLAGLKGEPTVLVFFAGHGALGTDDQYYLVSHDARFEEAGDEVLVKPGTGVSQVELLARLRALGAKRALLIFNACHSGKLQPQSLALRKKKKALNTLSLPDPTASALLGTGEGRIIMTACRPNQLSHFWGDSQLTFFAKALTDGLGGKAAASRGLISAFSLYTYVYEAVTRTAGKHKLAQEPMITVLQGVGPFAVARSAGVASLGPGRADTLPEGKGARVITQDESLDWLDKIERGVIVRGDYVMGDKVMGNKIGTQINTGGGAYVGGNVNTGGGGFVGRDQVTTIHEQTIIVQGSGAGAGAGIELSPLALKLYGLLKDKWFSTSDLQDLCFTLSLDWDSLSGESKPDKARALVMECERLDKLEQLRGMMRMARPNLRDRLGD